ncbi:hypothetical protein [Burkholderia anthina]|uniref:hypothetical protein n=1 Tax=Burkholderia anthina TaxID=179879 RepID=UPI0012D8AAF4|nr:hypothetical protein [Burkholderia anthina]
MLANKKCGQARAQRARRAARIVVPRLKQRGQSLSDQALGRGMRRLSTRLPTQSVDKHRSRHGGRRITYPSGMQPALGRLCAAL